jgi:hypothetical protein
LQSGYDLIREEEFPGTMLEQSTLPVLATALQRGKALRVTDADSQPADMKALSAALGLNETGSLMFIPISADENRRAACCSSRLIPTASGARTTRTTWRRARPDRAHPAPRAAASRKQRRGGAHRLRPARELESLRLENQKMRQEINNLRSSPRRRARRRRPQTWS